MNELQFEAEILRGEGVPADVVSTRLYGNVRVDAEWPGERSTPEIRVTLHVRGVADPRNAPAYVELFFHDIYLLLNLSTPGSFGGTVSVLGGELRVRELTFSPRVFEYASGLERVPLEQVVRWYDGLDLGTRQVAHSAEAAALFQLLHLARGEEDEEQAILRLANAAEALNVAQASARLFDLRHLIAQRRGPVLHPMHDDGLDPSIEDSLREWVEVADTAAGMVITELQKRIRKGG
ncbi:MAG TPA: hypothetical protein VEO54_00555 [Thermoanaerobaculia bacterium]|nr:hypothetical protein [Thermoanaerobaculia bacterium]